MIKFYIIFTRKLNYTSIIAVFFAIFLWQGTVQAQQEAHFAQNMFNHMAINPGFAGSGDAICANGIVRQQWQGFKDEEGNSVAPETYLFSIHSPLRILHGGLGLTIIQDKVAFNKEIGLKIAYAYRTDFAGGTLGIGAQLGFLNGTIDFSKFKPLDEDDPLISSKSEKSDMLLDFGFGVFYSVQNRYHIGLSTSRLSESSSPDDILAYKTKRHYFLAGGYDLPFPGSNAFEILPSFLIKSDGVKTQYDFAALVRYNNKVWGGVNYSAIKVYDPISVIVGLKIKDIRVGYAYGIPTSAIGSGGSHEINIGYCFKIEIDSGRRIYRNTRFF